jgi:hypothetical protein
MFGKFLWRVLRDNPVKLIFIAVILICIYGVTNYMWTSETKQTLNDQPLIFAGKYYYTLIDEQSHVESKGFDKPLVVNNHSVTYTDISPIFVLSCIGLVVLGICILVSTISQDDGLNWNIKKHWGRIAIDMIKCYEQDGYYYYVFKDRLLLKTDYQMTGQYNTHSKFSELLRDYREQKNLFPEWLPIDEKRDRKLKALIG